MRSRRSFFRPWKPGESLPLPLEPVVPTPVPVKTTGKTPGRSPSPAKHRVLWLAAQFPALTWEAHQRDSVLPEFTALTQEVRGQHTVEACSMAAANAGVRTGMTMAAALALVPSLTLQVLRPEVVEEALQGIALLAERFTSQVVILPPNQVLLEVGASLRLFGSWQALATQFLDACRERGFNAQHAVATTPQAAEWLALSSPGTSAVDAEQLRQVLHDVSLCTLNWPLDTLQQFESMGVRTLGECRRLPRSGFARRFGPARLLLLDRAYGVMPDPRPTFRVPERFAAELELSDEIDRSDLLVEAATLLVERLSRFLRTRQWVAQEVELRFYPLLGPMSGFVIRPAEAGQSASHWIDLIQIRLERWRLPAPAIVVGLYSDRFEPASGDVARLRFENGPVPARQSRAYSTLVERLQARLGANAVRVVRAVADARPEYAMRSYPVGSPEPVLAVAGSSPWQCLGRYPSVNNVQLARPLWLRSIPMAFSALPDALGRICLQSEVERIESGWWDGRDMTRDYYHASTESGARVWVFRERGVAQPGWYLQGYFG